MNRTSLAACCLALGFVVPTVAQQTQAPDTSTMSAGQASGGDRMKIQKDLEQAGFTEVQVTPGSFFVRAKDKEGQSVMMVIPAQHEARAGNSGIDLATGKHDAP